MSPGGHPRRGFAFAWKSSPDPKAARRLAAAVNVPHRQICRLEVATEALGVEQRAGGAVLGKLAAERFEAGAVARKRQRQRLVFLEAVRDELRKPGRLQHA